ncbi:MAG: glutamine synthetase type III [Desulfobacterales bacterium]|nr:glutamine synthetase type III [Desulfobacterales bacterium]
MSIARKEALKTIFNYKPIKKTKKFFEKPSGEIFGKNVFSLSEMKKRLPGAIFKSLKKTIETGSTLDVKVADVVAAAMKDWALEKKATHFAHVFYPLTGLTAEKHDSFYTPSSDGHAIAEFSGILLVQGEPDASSFPNGGIRQTFEARGYTAWDVTSPAYIMENANGNTLCIPTIFISWSGEALDKKTPVLRSMQSVNIHAQRILKLFGKTDDNLLNVTCGAEQEYFLIDNNFISSRPDILACGRTLFGAESPKGQQFDDHYFGAIQDRVLSFMFDVERELLKLGIPAKTRHNEVAPGQFELAPIYESANLATDHQQLTMVTLKKVAKKYGMTCLLHEKPFAGVNGSGKHVNFSIGNSTHGNLLDPGDNPHDNTQFLIFCAAIIRAVHKNSELLRAVVASAGNDHRLGANEAPPAILSIFLGSELTNVFEKISNGGVADSSEHEFLNVDVDTIPPLPKDSGDRNRTSPFAFTGNRFEFRAVGSDQSVADPMTVINTIITESLDYIASFLEEKVNDNQENFDSAVQEILKKIYLEHKDVVFNGDGYSDEWQKEAEERGLPNLKTTPEALPALISDKAISIFDKYNILTPVESHSRYEIFTEQYIMKIEVEAKTAVNMAETIIYPSSLSYQEELANCALKVREAGLSFDTSRLAIIINLTDSLNESTSNLKDLMAIQKETMQSQMEFSCNEIIPAMNEVRKYADQLEELISDDLWTLPSYKEMLFIR